MKDDPLIDRSPEQVSRLIDESRIALLGFGYSVVRTEWLHSVMDKLDKEKAHEETEHPRSDQGQGGGSQGG